jgi:hypothetical protein
MKKLLILIGCALLLFTSCVSKQVTDNKHIYDHAPFPNYNMSVFGFGAFSVTIGDHFKLVESKREGDIDTFKYLDPKFPHLEITVNLTKNDAKYDVPFTKEDVVYFKKERTTVLVYKVMSYHRFYGISILKYRDLGAGRRLYVEFKTGRDGQDYTPKDAGHLIAQFDSHIRMVNEGRIMFEMPPCPFKHN